VGEHDRKVLVGAALVSALASAGLAFAGDVGLAIPCAALAVGWLFMPRLRASVERRRVKSPELSREVLQPNDHVVIITAAFAVAALVEVPLYLASDASHSARGIIGFLASVASFLLLRTLIRRRRARAG